MRLNLTITDRHGLTVKLNEQGPRLERDELASVEGTWEAHLDKASWLMLCGSLPPGVPADFYAQLITRARKKGVKTLLDTDGEALSQGVEAEPTWLAPTSRRPSACSTPCCSPAPIRWRQCSESDRWGRSPLSFRWAAGAQWPPRVTDLGGDSAARGTLFPRSARAMHWRRRWSGH